MKSAPALKELHLSGSARATIGIIQDLEAVTVRATANLRLLDVSRLNSAHDVILVEEQRENRIIAVGETRGRKIHRITREQDSIRVKIS